MYETSDFKKGLRILFNDDPHIVLDFQHVKPGKGGAFIRTKLKNMITNANLDRTFKSGEKFGIPDVVSKDMLFLYKDSGNQYVFMNQTDFDQHTLTEDQVGEAKGYLTENLEVSAVIFNQRVVDIEVPNQVNLVVEKSDPGVKGNSATGRTLKPATMNTGLVMNVPLHINEGDTVRVDTRTGKYMGRQ